MISGIVAQQIIASAPAAPITTRTNTYTGSGSTISLAHTFLGGTQHAAVVLHATNSVLLNQPLPTFAVNGSAATLRAQSRFSNNYQDGAYIADIASPTSGNIVISGINASQTWTVTVYEFSQAMTFDAGTTTDYPLTIAAPTSVTTESVTLSAAGVAIFAHTMNNSSAKYVATGFSGADYIATPDALPVSTYYSAASGVAQYDTGGAKAETFTVTGSGLPYYYRCAAAWVPA